MKVSFMSVFKLNVSSLYKFTECLIWKQPLLIATKGRSYNKEKLGNQFLCEIF